MKPHSLLLLVSCIAVSAQPAQAAGRLFGSDSGGCKPAGCCDTASCQPCTLICRPEITSETVTKHCWEVECDYVCVPKVQCPISRWFRTKISGKTCCDTCGTADCRSVNGAACDGPPLQARIRTVRRLKKVEYDCEKRVVEWHVEQCEPGMGLQDCKHGCTTLPPAACSPLSR